MKRTNQYIVCYLTCLLLSIGTWAQEISVKHLRCEMLVNPLGIDTRTPRLSWQIDSKQRSVTQTAYEILVASSKEKLANNEGDLWRSGKLGSPVSILVNYAGKALHSGAEYYWKVRVYTNKGTSGWSAPALWSMGLLDKNDWKAKWIGLDSAFAWDSVSQFSRLSARYFRKPFHSNHPLKKAVLHIAGLGWYELFINGKRIGNQVLAPAPTDYRKFVLYNTYDVTENIRAGDNAVAAVLGNGRFFTMRQHYKPQKINTFGFPKMLMQLELEYANGIKETIVTDENWKVTADGPIRTNNEYDGEEYDANKELTGWNTTGFYDAGWMRAQLVDAPDGRLVAQMNEPIRVMRKLRPVSIKQLKSQTYVLDMGQNMVGWLQLKVKGKKGDHMRLRFAESLQPDGSIYVANLRDAKVTDVYTLKGKGTETWHPSFVFHGFRYVEVTGYPGVPTVDNFEGQVIYDDLSSTGSFESSNAILNKIYKNAWWGIAGNYKGMPIDCPQRNERQPWLGDRVIGALGESFLFDNAKLYAKWLNDIEQSQTAEGVIPDVAPAFWNYYSDNVTWPAAYITVADMLYRQYGDQRPIAQHYASMKQWIGHIRDKCMKDYLVTRDKYGDWCMPPESLHLIHSKDSSRITEGALLATAYYYYLLQRMQTFASLLNHPEDAKAFSGLQQAIREAFNKHFYNSSKKYYSNNTITANLLPLCFGMVPDSSRNDVFGKIVTKILVENHGHIGTGLIGSQWLMRGLSDNARPEIAYQMAITQTYPGWGYMAANGATTIWELWNGNTADPQMNSQNHVMLLGDLLTWMYEYLGGIRSDDIATGFKKIIMKPLPVDGLHFVKAGYASVYGQIKSEWKNSIDRFEWNITIPANTSAVIYIPAYASTDILEGGKPVSQAAGVSFLRMEGRNALFEIGSGTYSFVSQYPFRKGIVKDEFIFTEASFPESHASTIAETPKGLIAAWFGGTKEGNKDVCIWTSRLVNSQWTTPEKVADGVLNDSTRYACYNPVLYQVPNGELLLFYKIGPNVAGWTGWMKRSEDNGLTWSAREALPEGFLGPIKNKPEWVNGMLVCPSSTEKTGWKVHFEYTKDNGRTWTKSTDINDGKTISAIQPSILKYKDGRLQVLCRSRNTTINESWSHDGGKTWSPMQATSLPNNNSGTDAVTLKDGRQLLVYNHVKPPASAPGGKGARTPLTVALTEDGKKWYAVAVLENSPVSQYSYPSVIQTADGLVHIVYTWRRERIKHVVLDPAKIELQEIRNGQWPAVRFAGDGKPSDD